MRSILLRYDHFFVDKDAASINTVISGTRSYVRKIVCFDHFWCNDAMVNKPLELLGFIHAT
ncbi:hypothetical protein AS148_05045 [Achromobacter xylosoxidans]|nr:hypothetical protein AS148_05045 [Achromobacter xylosoxidans]